MSPERLLKHFDQIAEAPDAIPRLRRFILDLAVRGKLVEQNPKDEPAAELLKRIVVEKTQLSKEGVIRKKDILPEKDEVPFSIPKNWKWTQLGTLCFLITDGAHHTPIYQDAGIPFLSVKDVSGGRIDFSNTRFISEEAHHELCKRCKPEFGDILLTKVGTTGIAVTIDEDREFSIFVSLSLLKFSQSNLDRFFLKYLINSPFVKQQSEDNTQGIGNKNLVLRLINQFIIPIPPLAEQHRIVAKVDELMVLCDALEKVQAKRESRRDRLVASTLASISNSQNEINDSKFFINHLPRITSRPEHIKHLRQTILNLAVRGKLVPQDPNDEPVKILLEKIDHERTLITKKDRRADIELQILLADELCWEIPPKWAWRGVADLMLFIDYRGKTPTKVNSGVRLITAKNVRQGFINFYPEEFITETTYATWMTRGLPQEGDILFTTEAPMGNAAVVRIQGNFGLAQRVINFRPYGGLDPDFLVLQLLSQPFQAILDKTATGLTAKGIKAAKLKRLPIAIPPLAEQHRIVAKVDELMALCDELEARLTTTATTRHQLLEATLHGAIN